MDAADAFAVLDQDLGVASLSPQLSPGVFNQPVLALVSVFSIADDKHFMVEHFSALFVVVDTAPVQLESGQVALDSR